MKLGLGRIILISLLTLSAGACSQTNMSASSAQSAEIGEFTSGNWEYIDEAIRLSIEGEALAEDGKFQEALSIADKLDATSKKYEIVFIHILGSEIRMQVAVLREDPQLVSKFVDEIEQWLDTAEAPEEIRGAVLMNRGVVSLQLGKYEEGLSTLNKAKEAIEKSGAKDQEHNLASVEINLTNALTNMGRYQEALAHSQKSLEHSKAIDPADWKTVSRAKIAIGTTYSFLKDSKNAIKWLNEALAEFHSNGITEHPMVCQIEANLSGFYIQEHAPKEAEAHAKAALKLSLMYYGEAHRATIMIHSNLGAAYLEQNMIDLAAKEMLPLKELAPKVIPSNDPLLALINNNFKVLCQSGVKQACGS